LYRGPLTAKPNNVLLEGKSLKEYHMFALLDPPKNRPFNHPCCLGWKNQKKMRPLPTTDTVSIPCHTFPPHPKQPRDTDHSGYTTLPALASFHLPLVGWLVESDESSDDRKK